jgi:hypothetical protein
MQTVYNVNINDAKIGYKPDGNFSVAEYITHADKLNDRSGNAFSRYSPAYVFCNERINDIINVLRPDGKNVLAVAGSGDMPLFLTAYGAKHVDTFDISYNARVIMDIKTHMLHNKVKFMDYVAVLTNLEKSVDVTKCESWNIVKPVLNSDISEYLYAMRGCKIFMRGDTGKGIILPNSPEFISMCENVPERYNFIWSDLFDVCGQISGQKYDIIYLSNVFQYVANPNHIVGALNDFHKHLNPGGIMVIDSLLPKAVKTESASKSTQMEYAYYQRLKNYEYVGKKIADWGKMFHDHNAMTMFIKTK